MKAIGMLLIVWGHCFPEGMDDFIYAFNVPLFFVISGYLSKRDEPLKTCWKKCLGNLIIPYFILSFLHCAGFIFKHISDGQFLWSIVAIFGGFHKLNGASGCSNMWFVYTLVITKLLFCAFGKTGKGIAAMTIISVIGAIAYNNMGYDVPWAVTNTLVAMPFFVIGNIISYNLNGKYEKTLNIIKEWRTPYKATACIVLVAVTYILSYYNGFAGMFTGNYGNNILLFFVAATTGIILVLILSLAMQGSKLTGGVRIVALGSLVILSFHRELNHPILKLIDNADMNIIAENIAMFLCALIVVIAFIPITLIVQRIFPIVLGSSRAKAFKNK